MPFWKKQKQTSAASPSAAKGSHSSDLESGVPSPGSTAASTVLQYGMFVLHNKPSDAANVVDIVAVNGLNGHYLKTWTEPTAGGDVNWLRDLLPGQLPNSRVMSYSYNSAVAFSEAVAGIKTFADQLLEDLMGRRLTYYKQEDLLSLSV